MALSKRQVIAVKPGSAASSQRDVREQSPVGYLNGNIITFFESKCHKDGSVITSIASEI
jgi:hypothetical protein